MNPSSSIKIAFLCLLVLIFEVKAWDTDELEIFDLVEEINENFYALLGIKQDAKTQEIKRAFRNLSLILHPDKNSAEDADIKFRNLVSVYEVLKDTSKREKYDEVLKNGLPNWRSAVYYYRHVRKMGLTEMTIILFVLITIGQYIVGWAVYTEKRHTAEKLLGAKLKKSQKKNKATANENMLTSIVEQIPTPSVKDTLPFQIVRFFWNLPSTIKTLRAELAEQKRLQEEQIQREKEEEERLEQAKIDYEKAKENRGPRRRKPLFRPPEMTDEDYQLLLNQNNKDNNKAPIPKPRPMISGGLWTDDDLSELIRLVKKYPGGTPDRWERIAEAMNRPVPEVTHMSAKIKENCYRMSGQQEDPVTNVDILPEIPKKVKTKGGKSGDLTSNDNGAEANWSQDQQKALETALTKFPKGGTLDRWEKIAKCVQGKTKEECILRYKYLVELVKKQNQKEPENSETVNEEKSTENDENVKTDENVL